MGHRVSKKTKIQRKRGQGVGRDYRPWIRVSEVPGHLGTHHSPVDWKHGRAMHFLSDGELWQYFILRWRDDVIDVREQFPLPLEATLEIAKSNGLRHPQDKDGFINLTSDLVADCVDGHTEVYCVKYSREKFEKESNQIKNVWIEKRYWEGQEDVDFRIVFTNEMNRVLADNIARIVYYWDPGTVTDKVSYFIYMLAHKKYEIDLESEPIDDIRFYQFAQECVSDEEYERMIPLLQAVSEQYERYKVDNGWYDISLDHK